MNRNLKWNTSSDSKRTRRQRYQLLPDNEEEEEEVCSSLPDHETDTLINLGQLKPEEYVEKVLDPGETLQTLSLRFNCPVAELKRINHILRDNEIYARRKIKVPIKPGSVLTEKLAGVHLNNGISRSEEDNDFKENSTVQETTTSAVDKISLAPLNMCPLISFNAKECPSSSSSMCKDNSFLDVRNSHSSLLETNSEDLNHNIQSSKCSGADWGISWLQLLICALLLGVAGPMLYILYITEKKR